MVHVLTALLGALAITLVSFLVVVAKRLCEKYYSLSIETLLMWIIATVTAVLFCYAVGTIILEIGGVI